MAIVVTCPNPKCSANLTVEDDRGDTTYECPHCNTEMTVPDLRARESRTPDSSKYCHECGESIKKNAEICPKCGVRQPGVRSKRVEDGTEPALRQANGKKLAAGLCGIFAGGFGIHKFILGYNSAGLIMLLASVLTCGIGYGIIHIIGLVEGILYLTKSDVDFYQTYMVHKKEWF
jgi:TM2 domain-containing membrane protein YozV/predicted RNA-binding Zn-ribbon protein involved in translation (DUF1610 family)